MKEDFLNDTNYREMQLIVESEEAKIDERELNLMRKVRESDIKLNIHNDELFVEYQCVMNLVERYNKLVDKFGDSNE